MANKLKTSMVIIAAGALVYLNSLSGATTADVGSASAEETSAGATISLEACVVRVEIEAFEEGAGIDFIPISSISAEQVLSRVEADEAEVVSSVKVLVAEGAVAEIAAEQNAREKEKDSAKEAGEDSEWETAASLRAEVIEVDAGRVAVEFVFKQIISEHGSSGDNEAEREEEHSEVFEVSSGIGLSVGRPVIAGAKKGEGGAMFLILYADI